MRLKTSANLTFEIVCLLSFTRMHFDKTTDSNADTSILQCIRKVNPSTFLIPTKVGKQRHLRNFRLKVTYPV